MQSELDLTCINTLRFLAIDAVQKADSGHPGMPMGAAAMAYVLWTRFLRHNPAHPLWFDRDRFVLSAGHGSMLLYALLHLTGYDLPMEQLQNFRQLHSMTPGHPERSHTPGVETTTGPLGQGFATGVGMAIAERHLAAKYNRPGHEILNHWTYGIVGDGDLMEGVAAEAASLAGHLKLGKLIYLYDDNHITLAAETRLVFTEDTTKRFESYGWHVLSVKDGNDVDAIQAALEEARRETGRPSLIRVRTRIGYGSPNKQDTFGAHGSPLGKEEVRLTKQNLGWPLAPDFHVPDAARDHFRQAVARGKDEESVWDARFSAYAAEFPDLAAELDRMIRGELPQGWDAAIPDFPSGGKGIATRVASGKVINAIAPRLPGFIGGSADLNPSTHTSLDNRGDFGPPSDFPETAVAGTSGGGWNYAGVNIHFGVREHAMAAICNGLAAHGATIPFCATFLTFSDYMRPSIRLACLMELQVVYVFTHDSLALGEDGPTHQPVEQVTSLRAIPNLIVVRPADANETALAWRLAITRRNRPVALILSRQNLPVLDRTRFSRADGLFKGAYVLADADNGKPDIILIATGSEVGLIVAAQEKLRARNVQARIVSMPSWELFEEQTAEYRDSVLPPAVTARLAVEAGIPLGWCRYVGNRGDVIGVRTFGASAPADALLAEFGFTVENVVDRALSLLG